MKAIEKEIMTKEIATKDNVVHLKRDVDDQQLLNAEDSVNLAIQIREDLCNDITELTMEQILPWLSNYGIFRDPNRSDPRDLIMMEQSIAAALYRYYGLSHPLHEMTEEMFQESEEE